MAKNLFQILTYNNISSSGLERFGADFQISDDAKNPDAILLRSFDLHTAPISESVAVVGRAGAGVNNIPVEILSQKGVVVMNTPGANANAVNELVVAGMLLAARNLHDAFAYSKKLDTKNMKEAVEKGKKQFAGWELRGKTVGIIGLGAIGQRVAASALGLGMKVISYDPFLKDTSPLPNSVKVTNKLDKLLSQSDFVTIHVPLMDATKNLLGKKQIALMKAHAILLNFARDELVDEQATLKALDADKLARYVTDFPNATVHGHAKVIALPHLGASTAEAEENCAVMIVDQVKEFLQTGNIRNSVNYPNAALEPKGKLRVTLLHKNKPGVVASITKILGNAKINITEILNESRNDLAYTIIDPDSASLPKEVINKLQAITEVYKLRVLEK